MDKITVTTKLTFEDFQKVNFYFLYRKASSKFTLAFGIFILLATLSLYVLIPGFFTQFPVIPVALGLVMTALPPYLVLRASRKNYESNSRSRETIHYEFDADVIEISGESFYSKLTWDKVYELTVTRNWVLLWQNRQVANVIPRRDIQSNQLERIKDIVRKYPTVKSKF